MPPTPDPRANPYAPPAAAPVAPLRAGVDGSYERERRSVVIVLVLTVVTLGVYPGVWYVRRARFLDALSAQRKLGSLPYVYLALYCFALITGLTGMPDEPQRALDLVTGITSLVLAFRTARVLRSDLLRTGRMIDVSSLAVFFFGCAYLQYLVNRAAETPARLARPGA